ncbi:hypothetical protein V6N13_015702 [Hibiscus sabdariffa]|uniref:Dynein light chain n=1 Tax=Hibiscus sabdariffa TaxID=183260 RepID=A0ABR2CWF8_9ROSI
MHDPTNSDIVRSQSHSKAAKDKFERRKSDKENCDETLYIEAKKALDLGKSLGVQIVGDEVIEEMIRIEQLKNYTIAFGRVYFQDATFFFLLCVPLVSRTLEASAVDHRFDFVKIGCWYIHIGQVDS